MQIKNFFLLKFQTFYFERCCYIISQQWVCKLLTWKTVSEPLSRFLWDCGTTVLITQEEIWATALQSHLAFNLTHDPSAPVLVVLSPGDPGNGHRRWDRYRLDHQEQDCGHAVSGHSWILAGSAANDTGKSQTRADHWTQLVFLSWTNDSCFLCFLCAGRNLLVATDGQLCC